MERRCDFESYLAACVHAWQDKYGYDVSRLPRWERIDLMPDEQRLVCVFESMLREQSEAFKRREEEIEVHAYDAGIEESKERIRDLEEELETVKAENARYKDDLLSIRAIADGDYVSE